MSAASRTRGAEAGTDLGHLVRRFFSVLRARPLTYEEIDAVRSLLPPSLHSLFFEQAPADQRHAVEAARRARSARPEHRDLVLAALLHDVGKRHARLGVPGRVAASLMIKLRIPLPERYRIYRDHGPLAASELEAVGAPVLAVEFARHHHGNRPAGIDEATWEILVASDQQANTRDQDAPGISSTPQ